MEIRRVLRGENASFSPAVRPAQEQESKPAGRASVDRLELSQQWLQNMEEQRVQAEAALYERAAGQKKESNGILDMLDASSAEEQELDALSEELDIQMKCMKIVANIMKGRKVPPEDERYLMENDPDAYKLAMAMKLLVKEDKKECESVLKDEDENEEESGSEESVEAVPEDGGEVE